VHVGTLFGGLEFASESSGGLEPVNCSKGRQRLNCFTGIKFRREGCQVVWPEVLEKLNQMVESLQEEVSKSREPLDLLEQ
jgi:hypothetical protein